VSRLLHERVEGSTAPKTVVTAAGQAWQKEATETWKTMKWTQDRTKNVQFREEATAEARLKRGGGTAVGERLAGGPAAASMATGTTRGPAISSADGPFKRRRRTETSPSRTRGGRGSPEPCSSGQMTLVLGLRGPISQAIATCREDKCLTSAAPVSLQGEFHIGEIAPDAHISERDNFRSCLQE